MHCLYSSEPRSTSRAREPQPYVFAVSLILSGSQSNLGPISNGLDGIGNQSLVLFSIVLLEAWTNGDSWCGWQDYQGGNFNFEMGLRRYGITRKHTYIYTRMLWGMPTLMRTCTRMKRGHLNPSTWQDPNETVRDWHLAWSYWCVERS